MVGLKTVRSVVAVAAVLGALVPAAGHAAEADPGCGPRDFCLFSGPHQTGEILFQREVPIDQDGQVRLVSEPAIEPRIQPGSAQLPGLPEGLSCIAVLYEEPDFAGDSQEADYGYPIDDISRVELTGQPVGSIDYDCG